MTLDPARWLWAAGAILLWLALIALIVWRERRARARARASAEGHAEVPPDPPPVGAVPPAACGATAGRPSVKVLPAPGALRTPSVPPSSRVRSREIDSPRPVPP